tara:strand:- start:1613 stop:2167 length:555 start_codon:yes stop_codon:yes gene_type:complete
MNSKKINICVFCGSMKGNNSIYCSEAKKLGSIISKNKWNLIFGGGKNGLMGSVAEGFDSSKADIISVIPKNLNDKEVLFPSPNKKILVKNLFFRKEKMIALADFIIVLPGGIGTLDELLDVLSLNNLSKKAKKLIVLNINQYWDPLRDLIYYLNNNQFIYDIKKSHFNFIDTVDKTVKFIKNNL